MLSRTLLRTLPRVMPQLASLTVCVPVPSREAGGLINYKFDDDEYERADYEHSRITHKSNAEELIAKVPVIEVDMNIVRCKGVNELGLGHPVEYINVMGKHYHDPQVCKWCGLRYIKRGNLRAPQA